MKKTAIILVLCVSALITQANDIVVANADGVNIYYNYINNGTELEVTNNGDWNNGTYENSSIVIPDEVNYLGRVRKVTRIGYAAFHNSYNVSSIIVPQTVTSIGDHAFSFTSITTLDIPNSVTEIGENAFDATDLTEIKIPNSVTELSNRLFFQCRNLKKVLLPNTLTKIGSECFMESGIEHIEIPNTVKEIGGGAFYCVNVESKLESIQLPNSLEVLNNSTFCNCKKLKNFTFPSGLKKIGQQVFNNCKNISFTNDIPEGVVSIGYRAFGGCPLESISLPNTLSLIEWEAFYGCNSLLTIKSKMNTPCDISESTFTQNTIFNASLYIPKGTIDNYRNKDHWKNFVYIYEDGGNSHETTKCAKPTISYSNGKLTFNCETDGVIFKSTITDTDISSYNSDQVQLCVTYDISVYATIQGCDNSDVANATLCWIDVDPKTEGISNNIAQVRANAVLIQARDGQITITGTDDGTKICVYEIDGHQVGSTISHNGYANLNTNIRPGNIAIIKIGDKNMKVVVK